MKLVWNFDIECQNQKCKEAEVKEVVGIDFNWNKASNGVAISIKCGGCDNKEEIWDSSHEHCLSKKKEAKQ